MKKIIPILMVTIFVVIVFLYSTANKNIQFEKVKKKVSTREIDKKIGIDPVSHATMILNWDNKIIYTDPVGGAGMFASKPKADLVLITDIHKDHLDADTLKSVITKNTVLVVTRSVADLLPGDIGENLFILNNFGRLDKVGFNITAIPMYNLPESDETFHVKGRGNGYLIERGGMRVYVSGDTADIPEMRNIENIDIAFVAMNLPYTMSVESAADAVLDFKPRKVYPYHYREDGGLADVKKFKNLVNDGNLDIEVVLLDWYKK